MKGIAGLAVVLALAAATDESGARAQGQGGGAPAQSASALVVIVKGDKQFHQPGCAVVARAGSAVTVAKRGEAARRGLTAHDCDSAGSDAPGADPNAVKVATQANDNKYHRPACKKLGASRRLIPLEEAGRKWWPCPVCKPPNRQRKPPAR